MSEIKGYVTRSVLSTLGLSLYILADTFFIANGVGVLGLAALNIALPLFNLLTGLGLLLGMGGATLFALKGRSGDYFSQLLIVGGIIGLFFTVLGFFSSRFLALLLGASGATVDLTTMYMRFILVMAPFFILNNLCLAFIRNDQNPQLAMKAMICSSVFNMLFDYIFVFPMKMGMAGAALATVLSPLVSLAILSTHRNFSKRRLSLSLVRPKLLTVTKSIQLGLSSFLAEMSTGVSILVFNQVLIGLGGDIAIAAYGVLANILVVALSLFTGVAQGIQPLISRAANKRDTLTIQKTLTFGLRTSFIMAVVLYLILFFFKYPIISAFNRENDPMLIQLAAFGIPIFFLSLFGSSLNVVFSIFFSAIGHAKQAFALALFRGYIFLVPLVILLAAIWGLTGAWVSLPITEGLTVLFSFFFLRQYSNKQATIESA
ncbi:MATE family efflux transporter [Candidatus Enterococcus murrayae]|uniref:Polysaccharide biosynthesis C-terminal domain-containing protein n=1 Tax=Candidatus Enterococcus murrayae TaxID=2815321 RepID=A0ABS3HHT9_9ENTE|nr:MATE family efflux transporter [Enterococcus sp. MJM16]MBO0453021.1 polysaccharide biosynthesis C-terminal domain-containing protein [Enterococcus sp. MJM16]